MNSGPNVKIIEIENTVKYTLKFKNQLLNFKFKN